MNSSLQPSTRDQIYQLYDPQELLGMDSNVASGYIILMGGYADTNNNANNKKLDAGALNLAFAALIEGNVVEACFGVKTHTTNSQSSPSNRGAKIATDAKRMISAAVHSSDAVKEIAVSAYGQAFQVAIEYHQNTKRLNFLTRCFKWKPIHQKAETKLYEAFKPLDEAIAAAT